MYGVVFAAGCGTRMRPLTDRRSKPLLWVGDRSLLEQVFDTAHDVVDEFVVVTGYRSDCGLGHPDVVLLAGNVQAGGRKPCGMNAGRDGRITRSLGERTGAPPHAVGTVERCCEARDELVGLTGGTESPRSVLSAS